MIFKVFSACLVFLSGLLSAAGSPCITQWFDRDDPGGNGDYELLDDLRRENPGLICSNPTGIEVRTVSGKPASQTGNIFQVNDATKGFSCVNADQKEQPCADYEVRFTCPETFCLPCTTQWFDRDDPSGKGDYELLLDLQRENPGLICSNPTGIEVRTVPGKPAPQTENIFQVNDATKGLVCVNADQKEQQCADYEVRFTCPETFCSTCITQWFDRDDPSGKGDYELLLDLQMENPGLICSNPTGIEVRTVSGKPASQTGNIFQVNDATKGFSCVNADQKEQPCADYEVRFTCPETFCLPCNTQWFDHDDPSGNGDYELLLDLRRENPGSICPDPTGIEVQTISGKSAYKTGNIFQVNDPIRGFSCVNEQQQGLPCEDYMVRFTCPQTFC